MQPGGLFSGASLLSIALLLRQKCLNRLGFRIVFYPVWHVPRDGLLLDHCLIHSEPLCDMEQLQVQGCSYLGPNNLKTIKSNLPLV